MPPCNSVVGEGLVIHCLYREPSPELIGPDLIVWFRKQVVNVIQVVRLRCSGQNFNMMGMTIRFQERGENSVVYGCDIAVDQFLPVTAGVDFDPAKMVMREWSHDNKIDKLLRNKKGPLHNMAR